MFNPDNLELVACPVYPGEEGGRKVLTIQYISCNLTGNGEEWKGDNSFESRLNVGCGDQCEQLAL